MLTLDLTRYSTVSAAPAHLGSLSIDATGAVVLYGPDGNSLDTGLLPAAWVEALAGLQRLAAQFTPPSEKETTP